MSQKQQLNDAVFKLNITMRQIVKKASSLTASIWPCNDGRVPAWFYVVGVGGGGSETVC